MNENTTRSLRLRARVETTVAVITGILCVVTPFWPDWIEGLTGWDPDNHNGSVEWAIVVGLVVVTIVLAVLARRSWHRLRLADGT